MSLAQDAYFSSGLTLSLGGDEILDKIKLSIETNPVFANMNVGTKGSKAYVREDPPKIMLTIYNTGDQHFDKTKFNANKSVGTFALTSDNDSDTAVWENLVAAWPPSAWVYGQKKGDWDNENASQFEVEIVTGVRNPTA